MEYAHETTEDMAKAMGNSIPISHKVAIEIANEIRGMNVDKATDFLKKVKQGDEAIPMKRFTEGAGHKTGMAAGKHPEKASEEFLRFIKMAKDNAINQGLEDNLILKHVVANKAENQRSYGRHAQRTFKRTHLQIFVEEVQE